MDNVLFTPGEGSVLVNHLTNLINIGKDLLDLEARLMKINAPAVVIGDLQGNLASVMTINQLLCPTIPVLQNNIVFLGNYISPSGSHNVEVLCFLIAIKIQAPNKVMLLRGYNENMTQAKQILQKECTEKYDDVAPQVLALLCDLLEKLPFAALIDESIICMHSGVPKTANRLSMLADIPNPLRNIEDCHTAYEVSFHFNYVYMI